MNDKNNEKVNITVRAKSVLKHADAAFREIEQERLADDKWWRQWLLTLTLLRMVGEVLRDPLGVSDSDVWTQAEQEWWKRIKTEDEDRKHIYWAFICQDRNMFIHHLELNADEWSWSHPDDSKFHDDTYKMVSGPFEERNQSDVVREAIRWWRDQIDWIDQRAQEIDRSGTG